MQDLNLKVNGMVCGGCENRVKTALSTIDGIEKVSADHNTGIVTVKAQENVSIDAIVEKIEDIGFEVEK